MSLDEVLKYFAEKYPNAQLSKLPENNPTEILCEVDPTAGHPGYSIAVAAISSSAAHFHKVAQEDYEVIRGTLLMQIGDDIKTVYEREKVTIPAGQVHFASSVDGFALVSVVSRPGWTPQDHFLV